MQFFTFNIIKFQHMTRPHHYSGEPVGGFYLVEDWEEYIDRDGKFKREDYQKKSKSLFL